MTPGAKNALGLVLFSSALYLVGLGARDLWNPNEPTYGLAVVEMAARGEWLVPTVNGSTFAEKPILYYWLALAVSRFAGIDEFTLRLPSAAAGVATVLLTYLLVLPYAGPRRGRIAALLVATEFLVFWASRSIQMDLFVLASTLGVLTAASRVLDHRLSASLGWTLAGLSAGLGFLAKGPVAWICPALALLAYAGVTGRIRELFRPAALLSAAVAVAVSLPWLVALEIAGRGDVLHEVLVRQNFMRFVEAWDHQNPWWYYLRYFWIDFAPWSWLAPVAVALPGRTVDERRLDRLALCSVIPVIAFFSLSDSKRSAYALPVAAGVAVLASGVVERFLDGRLERARRRFLFGLTGAAGFAISAAGVVIATVGAGRVPGAAPAARVTGGVAIVAGASLLCALLVRHRRRAPAVAVASIIVVCSLYVSASLFALPAANVRKSARGLVEEWETRTGVGDRLVAYRLWPWRASYAFYARRPIPILDRREELAAIWDAESPVWVLVEEGELAAAREVVGSGEAALARRIGERGVYVFANERAVAEGDAAARAGPGQ